MTTHIDAIEDKSSLQRYYKRMVMIGTTAFSVGEMNQVKRLDPEDPEGKRQLNHLADRAENLSGANNKRERGTHLHDLSEYVDRGEELPPHASAQDRLDMAAYKAATEMMQVIHIERLVVVPELKAAGTPDRVSFFDGLDPDGAPAGHLITDLKTGTVEYGALKMAMQLAGYSRGKLYDHTRFPVDAEDKAALATWKKTKVSAEEAAQAYTALPDVNQRWGLIMNLPAGSGQCTVYWVDLTTGWDGAQLCSAVRRMRSRKNVLVPFERV
ncbi:hypothetical protein AB0J80_36150 [Actinoplanes sp. NPDC049548]|uniref:hypothetical protein n=1 Tax=Actinoplanes sp. NPDC049548 TaxID=3155152 RepID=UPI00342FD3CE